MPDMTPILASLGLCWAWRIGALNIETGSTGERPPLSSLSQPRPSTSQPRKWWKSNGADQQVSPVAILADTAGTETVQVVKHGRTKVRYAALLVFSGNPTPCHGS